MQRLFDIYSGNYWLIAFHLLLLAAFICAWARIARHPGPSICVILVVLQQYGNFLWAVFDLFGDRAPELQMHVRTALSFAGEVLLFLAIFGWRPRCRPQGTRMALSDSPGRSVSLPAVRIPVGWVTTLTIIAAFIIVFDALLLLGVTSELDPDAAEGFLAVFLIGSAVAILIDVILSLEILYRAWQAIQDGQARTTPGKAIGYLFIPLYNLYWVFVAWAGFAQEFNAFTARYRIPTRRLSEGFFALQCVLMIVGIVLTRIPVVGLVYSIILSITALMVLWSITGAVNELYAHVTRERDESSAVAQTTASTAKDLFSRERYAPPGYFD
ncbi:MAG: hypothetical protein JW993_07550 [Sedimentisphaerales bacterium]|nr:hypothetical protein [Sedimentisphaerales bacterium]